MEIVIRNCLHGAFQLLKEQQNRADMQKTCCYVSVLNSMERLTKDSSTCF